MINLNPWFCPLLHLVVFRTLLLHLVCHFGFPCAPHFLFLPEDNQLVIGSFTAAPSIYFLELAAIQLPPVWSWQLHSSPQLLVEGTPLPPRLLELAVGVSRLTRRLTG